MNQPRTTPVPNVIFDVYLKDLSSAELKVLLVVIRQTLGWADRRGMYGRKETDWISGSQLRQKTGSSKRAITSAIDLLVRRRIIEVEDDRGHTLNHPLERKGKTRLYYRLNLSIYTAVDNYVNNELTNANFALDFSKKCTELVQKMRITKEIPQN
jgi:biotin operon repressor